METINEIFRAMAEVTRKHFQNNKEEWTVWEQILHIHSEVSEVYEAFRHKEGSERILEEMIDVVFTTFTALWMAGFTEEEIKKAMDKKLSIVRKRAGIR